MARIGVDIGGTFTDIVLERDDGTLVVVKASSTTAEPERAVVTGVAEALARAGIAGAGVSQILHGTTVGSNTILQRAGAPTGLLTTRGFRDVLEIGRVRTPELFDLAWRKPEPLARRAHRLEVDERIGADGAVVRPLDVAGAVEAARSLVAAGVRSLAICFLHSYRNPAHERAAVAAIRAALPDLPVSASADILPLIKEYERTSTTVVNAYVAPVMRRYLDRLVEALAGIGVTAPLLVVNANGGAARAAEAAARPVFFVGSGPAAGVTGAAALAARRGEPQAIVLDMGGTTAKASLIRDGEPSRTQEYEFREGISTPSRFIKAGGYLLRVPAIDVAEVGAGAGSIARVDVAGLLCVGPLSAGGEPGPACYGRGGEAATVTDANLVLGLLDPAGLVGGRLPLLPERAAAAIRRDVALPLGLDLHAAALGIRRVANATMVRALRTVTVERGVDPRDSVLIAIGGSGPLHGCDVAEALSIRRVLVPPSAGVFTARGMLEARIERQRTAALHVPIEQLATAASEALLDRLAAEVRAELEQEGLAAGSVTLRFEADLQLEGQDAEVAIQLDRPLARAPIEDAFRRAYQRLYQYHSDDVIEATALRVIALGPPPQVQVVAATAVERGSASVRPVWFASETGPRPTPVVAEADARGRTLEGPAIIASYDATIVVPPGWHAAIATDGLVELEHGR